jgi:hypothetical protein
LDLYSSRESSSSRGAAVLLQPTNIFINLCTNLKVYGPQIDQVAKGLLSTYWLLYFLKMWANKNLFSYPLVGLCCAAVFKTHTHHVIDSRCVRPGVCLLAQE